MHKKITTLSLALLTALWSHLPAKASSLEEIKVFASKPSLTMKVRNIDEVDLPTGGERSYGASYSIENIPFIPDFRVEYAHLHSSGTKILNTDLKIADLNLEAGTELHSRISADNIKFTFYYQPIDRFNYDFANLELGINLLFVDYRMKNTFSYKGGVSERSESLSTVIPSIHLKLSISPTYYMTLFVRGALPTGSRMDREIEGGVEYYLNPQLYLFGSYGYSYIKANNLNGYDFRTTSKGLNVGVGFIW